MPYKQSAKQSAKPGLRDSVAKAKIRVLLGLWDLDATKNPVKKGEVIKWVKNSHERSADYDPVLEELVAKGAIAVAGNQISLSARGLGMLDESLTSAELSLGEGENGPFEFPGSIIGTKVANALPISNCSSPSCHVTFVYYLRLCLWHSIFSFLV